MPHTISWNNSGFIIDGEPKPLISGEFHYFRVPHKDWKERLIKLKESGANTVATYIPWIIHEPEEGNIVFDDCPQRNLTEFLELCAELDLMVIARPGPYQYAELVYCGLPVWLIEGHPEILAKRIDGTKVAASAVSYLHPFFLEKAREYIRSADKIITPFLSTNGGPIISVQIDNELCGVQVWSGSIDYNPEGMGFGKADGVYPSYLKEKYQDIKALNLAYNTDFSDFTDINPCTDAPSDETVFGKRFRGDYFESYCVSIEKYALTVADWFKEDGIDVPLCANAASLNESPLLYRLPQLLKRDNMPFLMGTDHYYTLNPDSWENNPTPQEYLKWMASLDIMYEMGMPRTLFEMQGGTLSDFPPMQPETLSAFYFLQNALGLKGANYYIFTGGPNFGVTGSTGDVYDYHAAIGADGEIRPHYYCQKERNEHTLARSWMQTIDRTFNIQLGFTWEQRRQDKYSPRFARDDLRLNKYTQSLQFALIGEGYHPKYCEIGNELDTSKLLLLPCDGRMTAEKQKNVIDFIKKGGKVIITPFVPETDEDFNPCTLLKDYIGMGEIKRAQNPQSRIAFDDGELVYGISRVYTCDGFDGTPILRQHVTGDTVAYKKEIGKGSVIWLGCSFTYSYFSQNMLIDRLFGMLGSKPITVSDSKYLWTTLFEDGENAICYLINLLSGKQTANIKITANGKVHDLGNVEVPAMTVMPIDL